MTEKEDMTKKEAVDLLYINHDIRNYIGAAISHVQLLTMQHPELEGNQFTKAVVEALNEADSLSGKASMLVRRNMHESSRPESSSKLETYVLDKDYFEAVDRSYDQLRRAYSMEINVSFTLREGSYAIKVNLEALKALRLNLISNSHDAGATVVNASYEMKEYCLVVTISDNGRGMDQEALDKITLSQHGDGVVHGLGTKSILQTAEDNGFFVSFSSENGQGTTYRALCPYAKVQADD